MDVKKKVELVAANVIDGFDPKNDMCRSLYDLGLDSLDKLGFLMDVETECHVSMPERLIERLDTVEGVVLSVENLKRVKKVHDTWVPCALNASRKCGFMSSDVFAPERRSSISPNADFCKAIACDLYCGRQR